MSEQIPSPLIRPEQLDDPRFLRRLARSLRLGTFGPAAPARRVAAMLCGLGLLGVGVGLHIASGLGAAALDAAGVGVARHLDLAVGWGSSILVATLVSVAWVLGQRPGIGTLGVIFGGAPVVNATVAAAGDVSGWVPATLCWCAGMVAVAAGSSLLVAARLGAASLELATLAVAHRRVRGRPIGIVAARWGIEGALLTGGVLLGGAVGVGTAAFALCAGPALKAGIPVASRLVYSTRPVPAADTPTAATAAATAAAD